MTVTHPTSAVRSGMADNLLVQLNGGTIELQTGAAAAISTMALGATAYNSATNGTAQAANLPLEDTNANAGIISQAQQKSSAAVVVVQCDVTITGGGGDIQLSSVDITAGDTVRLTDLTYSAPP